MNHLQVSERIQNGCIQLYVKQNNFRAGCIILADNTFYSCKRTAKNLMRMIDSGALGINSEILNRQDFQFIEIPYEGTTLRTTRRKWLLEGIVSPYSDSRVDQQILLPLDKINMQEVIKTNAVNNQPTLFEAA